MTLADQLPGDPDPGVVFDAFCGWSARQGLRLYPLGCRLAVRLVNVELDLSLTDQRAVYAGHKAGA